MEWMDILFTELTIDINPMELTSASLLWVDVKSSRWKSPIYISWKRRPPNLTMEKVRPLTIEKVRFLVSTSHDDVDAICQGRKHKCLYLFLMLYVFEVIFSSSSLTIRMTASTSVSTFIWSEDLNQGFNEWCHGYQNMTGVTSHDSSHKDKASEDSSHTRNITYVYCPDSVTHAIWIAVWTRVTTVTQKTQIGLFPRFNALEVFWHGLTSDFFSESLF